MTYTELNRAVSRATGETVDIIANRGFSPLFVLECEDESRAIDWDEFDPHTLRTYPRRRRSPTVT